MENQEETPEPSHSPDQSPLPEQDPSLGVGSKAFLGCGGITMLFLVAVVLLDHYYFQPYLANRALKDPPRCLQLFCPPHEHNF